MFCNVVSAQDSITNGVRSNNIIIQFKLPSYTISDTVLPSEYGVSQMFKYIHMADESYGIIDSVGLPVLPQKTFTLSLPANVQSVSASITNTSFSTIDIASHILPCQEDISKDSIVFNYTVDNTYYSSGGGAFNTLYELDDIFDVHGVKGVSLSVMPFIYNPSKKQLQILQQATITLSYTCDSVGDSTYSISQVWDDYLSHFFDNYTPTVRDNTSSGRYLIITHPKFASTIQQFADYKRNIGFDVDIMETNNSGVTANSVKSIILTYYNWPSHKPDFVLLVGDHQYIPSADGDSTTSNEKNPITDQPYSLNPSGDNEPDVFIGRFPVSDTNQLKIIVNKTISMEMNLPLYEKKAKFIAGYEDNPYMELSFNLSHDLTANTYEANGYDCQLLYQKTLSEIHSALDDNPYLFVYSGHGSFLNWSIYLDHSICMDSDFLNSSNNTTFPIAFAFACKTGYYAIPVCIGEEWLINRHGGVGYFGSSIVTRPITDMVIEYKILREAFFEMSHLGGIIELGKHKYRTIYPSFVAKKLRKRYIRAYNLFGDPSFAINGVGFTRNIHANTHHIYIGDTVYYNGEDTVYTGNGFIVNNGGSSDIAAGREIILSAGTEFKRGSFGHIHIQSCCSRAKGRQSVGSINNLTDVSKRANTHKDLLKNNEIQVYPNPTSGIVYIEYELSEDCYVTINLYSANGMMLGELSHGFKNNGINTQKIDLSNYPHGTYFVQFTSKNHTNSCRIVKD